MRFEPLKAAALLAPLLLAGCGGAVSDAVGLGRTTPDEFAVVRQAPLEVPPSFALVQPTPGAVRPQAGPPRLRGERVITGAAGGAGAAPSAGEGAFLSQAGAGGADPNIRSLVEQESAASANSGGSLADSILFWRRPAQPGTVVDPAAEAQRIAGNVALGRPLTEGETPVIEPRERGPLEGLVPSF